MIRVETPTRAIDAGLKYNFELFERGVTDAVGIAEEELKQRWRSQVRRAGLGNRLANSIRGAAYPTSTVSANAKALVWTRAPKLIAAHEQGALIRARRRRYLAIPTDAAGTGRGGGRITPAAWEQRSGIELRPIKLRRGGVLLVADDVRINSRGAATQKRGRRRRDGILTGAQSAVIFILIPQAKLPKRLNLQDDARAVAAALPSLIAAYTGAR
ncbi:DUF6441 family protein [Pelagovum pacificum]|uniref:Uncharacterized protein n=1 Tax=Pelagovum pacificum TaxID=2588711 RepID=A0A5C5GFR5_9RHOB|nr:DUF6441 family protein [Pelagovum pacificum]QQA43954.1 hypothetical protein I8N54_05080 [Pelagovum pacificum]TNY32917.1 hypothetical protein FHY64_06470 [Pelagovum pacificum]